MRSRSQGEPVPGAGSAPEEPARDGADTLRVVFQHAAVGIAVLDRNGRFVQVNERMAQIAGRSAEELCRIGWADVTHPDDRSSHLELLDEVARGARGELQAEQRCLRPDGQPRWLHVTASSLGADAGPRASMVVIVQDVTARRHAEQAVRRKELALRRLLESLPAGAYTCDPEGLITYYNEAATRVWGRAPALHDPVDRFCGSFRLFTSAGAPLAHSECWMARALHEQRSFDGEEIVIERPDGSRLDVLAHAQPLRDGSGTLLGAVNILIDITDRKRAERALSQSELRFSNFMQHLPGLAWIKDLEGRYLYANEQAEKAFGRSAAQLYGRTDEEIFPSETAAQFRDNDRRALESSGSEQIETLEHLDGEVRHSLVRKFPIPGADGKPDWIGGIAIDVTERLRAEEALRASEHIYRAIGESIDYGVWVCDPEGRNVYASESFLKLVGMTQQECSEFGWGDVLHPEDAEPTLAAWKERVRTDEKWDTEHRFRGVDGRWHPVLARGVPVKDDRGETIAWAGINLDISRLKQVEEELREAHRRKDEFLATLAHELRNPLAPIRNAMSILRITSGQEGHGRLLQMMERQVDHMVRLVDDLLEVSRITRGKIELRRERVEIASILRTAIEASRPLVDAARQDLAVRIPSERLVVDVDALRLVQVVTNLLNNASKYTEERGKIEICARREGDVVAVSVRDDGIGIPPEMLGRIFDLFAQVDHARGRAQGGLGIGLTLVKQLVQMHGGDVEARSNGPGMGSEFVLRVPLAEEIKLIASGANASGSNQAPTRRRILVVDDNRDAADSLGMLLRMLGAEACVVYDGASALEALDGLRPELVLLDLGMPGMDGFEVARAIANRPDRAAMLLVALSGWGQPEDRVRTREAGFDHHVVKPVEVAALRSLIATLGNEGVAGL